MGRFPRALRHRRSAPLALALVAFVAMAGHGSRGTLPEAPGPRGPRTEAQAAIERQSVCIGSAVASAGRLGDVLYYRATQAPDGTVHVGYFAFFSEERPWGNNWLTWTVVPALAVDMVYSRTLLVAPGLQRALYGAGDVEGVTIVYRRDTAGRLSIDHAFVDDRSERQVELSRAEIFALDARRPTFYSDVWSHQLGGRSAAKRADLVDEHCYEGDSVRPLPDRVARAFHLDGRRAAPAHVERLDGRRLDDVDPSRATLASAP